MPGFYYLLASAAGPLMANFFQDLGTSTKFDILITFWPAPLDLSCPIFSEFWHLYKIPGFY